jgi:hypothetical protein
VYIKEKKTPRKREVVTSGGRRYAKKNAALINGRCNNINLRYELSVIYTRRRRPRATNTYPFFLSFFLSAWWRSRHHHSDSGSHHQSFFGPPTHHRVSESSHHEDDFYFTPSARPAPAIPCVYTLIYFQIHTRTRGRINWNGIPGGGGRGSISTVQHCLAKARCVAGIISALRRAFAGGSHFRVHYGGDTDR